jgi:competence protein ComEC
LLLADLAIAAPFAWGAEWCIKALNITVANSEWLPGGFYFCSGPPLWWAAGMLALVWIPFVAWPRKSAGWLHGSAVVSWSVLGLCTWATPSQPRQAAFHQLSVGHGNAGVLQTRDGRVFLIDCGSMTFPGVGERIIAPFLWRRGIQTIDAVFLSHADVDHFNGLPALLARFRVGVVYTPPQFARMEQPAVKYAADSLRRHQVPLRFVWAGDRMMVGDVELDALWPTPTARGRSDNSNSLVLDARCRGRSVLSTGDLAEEGLRAVMRMEHPAIDLFVIPHHGGRSCNPPELAEWAAATVAVGSQHGKSGDSMGVYRDAGAITLRTDVDGALSMQWQGDELLLTTFRTGRWIRICK